MGGQDQCQLSSTTGGAPQFSVLGAILCSRPLNHISFEKRVSHQKGSFLRFNTLYLPNLSSFWYSMCVQFMSAGVFLSRHSNFLCMKEELSFFIKIKEVMELNG